MPEDYTENNDLNVKVWNVAISDDYVEHGNVEVLRKEVGLGADTIFRQITDIYPGGDQTE